jgi:Mrp family chromosome partitioning ATPase
METSLPIIPMPEPAEAIEVAWSSAESKRRGIFGFDSLDARSRSFNLIRAKLIELQRERGWRLIGVVSATPSVGKSFVAANIAAALSRSPRHQTYAVDIDLRRASLSALFELTPKRGIRAYLEEERAATFPDVYRPQGQRLLVVPTRAGPIHSAELLAGANAQAFFRSVRVSDPNHFFLFDLPPVFANDDAVTAMARLDCYVVVAEEGKTKQKEVADTVELLGRDRLAGVILNKYRGGMVSEGYGVDSYYAAGYEPDAVS